MSRLTAQKSVALERQPHFFYLRRFMSKHILCSVQSMNKSSQTVAPLKGTAFVAEEAMESKKKNRSRACTGSYSPGYCIPGGNINANSYIVLAGSRL